MTAILNRQIKKAKENARKSQFSHLNINLHKIFTRNALFCRPVLVKWLDEGESDEQLLDVLPSKSVQLEEHDVLDIVEGAGDEANFGGRWYSMKIIGKGMMMGLVSIFAKLTRLTH